MPKEEKRVFPRFPFNFMTLKSQGMTFEIPDAGPHGLMARLKDGHHGLQDGQELSGQLHWKEREISISGTITWARPSSLGMKFDQKTHKAISSFLGLQDMAQNARSLHLPFNSGEEGLSLPANLKYWISSQGPFEIFFWAYSDGEFQKIQIRLFDFLIEWEDLKGGARVGRIISRSQKDSPLELADELEVSFQTSPKEEQQVLDMARRLLGAINGPSLPTEALDFIRLKL